MHFGTEAGFLKCVGSQDAFVEVKGAASGMSGLWAAKTGREENSVTGRGHTGVFQQRDLVRRRKNHLYLSHLYPLPHFCVAGVFPPDCIILHLMGTGKSGSAHGAGN